MENQEKKLDRYSVVIKVTYAREGYGMEDALRKAMEELPERAVVLEAMVFPSAVRHR